MHCVSALKKEAVAVHAPAGEVEPQLEGRVVTISVVGEAGSPGAPKVSIAMLPRAVAVILVASSGKAHLPPGD